MPSTPAQRTTRSNSNTQTLTFADVKTLIDKCKSELKSSLDEKLDKLGSMMETLISRVEVLEKNYETLLVKMNEDRLKCNTVEEKTTSEVFEEMEDRRRRLPNLIFSGLEECPGTVEERRKSDDDKCRELLSYIGCPSVDIEDVRRVGRIQSNKPRLIRIVCKSVNEKFDILRKAKLLRQNAEYRNIYINPDRTIKEQKEARELRVELKERRSNGEDVVIHRNHVVQRTGIQNFHKKS